MWLACRFANRPWVPYFVAQEASAGSQPSPATKNSAQQW
ncbi:Uncharacterised protein [Mycobacterium tuberculosis]|uniref:Uncharacterized protein n=1 Tax=Mycobacterium tuberculosis TaxID=1773 RepID=A0A916PD38_MYCTX|nr:Uncharacterised protein [Mycobacterium tuberculosis]COZ84909.1 Uncharacterised protein [Mycobacterium tuberculosis]